MTQQHATEEAAKPAEATFFDLMGGAPVIASIVDRFYDLMETDTAYAELRALHAGDLAPMRKSLAGFLAAWTGGPTTWFEERPGTCIMSAHARISIDAATSGQWVEAMRRAIDGEAGLDPRLAEAMRTALSRMARGMINRCEPAAA